MDDFVIRAYTKKELALCYFPNSKPHTAVNHLMSWVQRCTPLRQKLQEMGYFSTSKLFTPGQVRAIVEMLGEP